MSNDITRKPVRCALEGHVFDFNEDLGAVYMRAGSAACTPCMDRLFSTRERLQPNGTQPYKRSKPKLLKSK